MWDAKSHIWVECQIPLEEKAWLKRTPSCCCSLSCGERARWKEETMLGSPPCEASAGCWETKPAEIWRAISVRTSASRYDENVLSSHWKTAVADRQTHSSCPLQPGCKAAVLSFQPPPRSSRHVPSQWPAEAAVWGPGRPQARGLLRQAICSRAPVGPYTPSGGLGLLCFLVSPSQRLLPSKPLALLTVRRACSPENSAYKDHYSFVIKHIEPSLCRWSRKWQPTAVRLPGESHGQRNLAGYGPWGRKKSDMTEHTCTHPVVNFSVKEKVWVKESEKVTALFTIANVWKQAKCPPTDGGYIYVYTHTYIHTVPSNTVAYYSAIKRMKSCYL